MTASEPRPDGTDGAEPTPEQVVVRDKRRLDPDSGEIRLTPEQAADDAGAELSHDFAAVQAELTADLQRLSAEYANYRKRVERDRVLVVEMATAGFLEGLLPLLDSIELARQHGDLEGAFKGVGESLEQLAERHGLERYGQPGDAFDPAIHNALMQVEADPDATVATVAQLLQPGWRLRSGRILRPAGVAVAEAGAEAELDQADPSAVPEQ